MDTFWATLIGSAIGVVAGAIVQYIVSMAIQMKKKKKKKNAFKTECIYNKTVIDKAIERIDELNSHIARNTLSGYFVYLPLEKGLHVQVNNFVTQGEIYEFFGKDDLTRILGINMLLTGQRAIFFQDEINKKLAEYMQTGEAQDRQSLSEYVDHVKREMRSVRDDIIYLEEKFS